VEGAEGHLNTSFLRRVKEVKDNRLRPKGFDPAVFANNPSPFIRQLAELPGEERFDPYYTDPRLTGADQIEYVIPLDAETLARVDHVQVSLYHQPIPPFYLQERFRDAHRGPGQKHDIQRLYHITSHLDVHRVMGKIVRNSPLRALRLVTSDARRWFPRDAIWDNGRDAAWRHNEHCKLLRTLIVERHVTVRTWWKRGSLEHTLCVNCRKESVPEPMPLYKFAEKLVEFKFRKKLGG
jgi:hypothetical protein